MKTFKKWLFRIIMTLCILTFLGSGGYLGFYYFQMKETRSEITDLQKLREEDDATPSTTSKKKVKDKKGRQVSPRYQKLYEKNDDFIGWIQVKDTPINYPVMQTPKENEFYLHRNFYKKYDMNGLPFLDAKCDTDGENQNLFIYGHHMRSGLIFAHLLDFAKADFFQKHKTVVFDTLQEARNYQVVAAFYSQVNPPGSKEFSYYHYVGKLDKDQFSTYVEQVKKRSLYKTSVTPVYGDELLTLVTCAYHTTNGRFVVVCSRTPKN